MSIGIVDRLVDLKYVDLYVSDLFFDLKEKPGAGTPRVPVPSGLQAAKGPLLEECVRLYEKHGPEFGVLIGGVRHRATQMPAPYGGSMFCLRRSSASLRSFASLGLPAVASQFVTDPCARGLVLIVGEMGSGKTSTASSIIVERAKLFGGVTVAIEDPIETTFAGNGSAGEPGVYVPDDPSRAGVLSGRIIQVEASRATGGYQEQLIRALRWNADCIFLGEIRDETTARLAVREANNGHLIITTSHAASIVHALTRLADMTGGDGSSRLMATGLSLIVHQELRSDGQNSRVVSSALSLVDRAIETQAREKIRRGDFSGLAQEIDQQARSRQWQPQPQRRG